MTTPSGKQPFGTTTAPAGDLLGRARARAGAVRAPAWAGGFAGACRRDPHKAGAFVVLVAILATMWVRLAAGDGSGRSGPAAAAARAAGARANRAGGPAGAGAAGEAGGRGGAAERRAVDAALADWRSTPVLPPRNLFAVKFEYFPRDGTRAAEPVRGGGGFWAELGKSLASRTDDKHQRQVLIENLRLQAAKLRLETTVMAARPTAVINGELVGEGDVVASGSGVTRTVFRVCRIEARRVIVEREGIKLEIPMK